MNLEEHIEDIRAGIRAGSYANEASVSQGIVLRLLQGLGWPTYDTKVVCPEYSMAGRRVDFGLCHPASKPIAFIEVKQLGQSEGAERQLFEYAFHAGVPVAILTDGREWNFFLPAEQGDYAERRVYKLDIVDRELSECVSRLGRYLAYQEITSGRAVAAAREDYRNVSRDRQMKETLPLAWCKLVEEKESLLLELVADRVATLCGFKPEPDTVARFLNESVMLRSVLHSSPTTRPSAVNALSGRSDRVPPPTVEPIRHPPTTSRGSAPISGTQGGAARSFGFRLMGQQFGARNAMEVLVSVFEILSERDPSFPERFAATKQGRRRRYLARTPGELFPDRPDLAEKYHVRLKSGWYLGKNLSRDGIGHLIEDACAVAGLRYGVDLVAEIGK